MDPAADALQAMRQFVDTNQAAVVDARSMGGEVVKIPILNMMQVLQALDAVAENLQLFMERVTGRGYRKAEEVYNVGFTVREPGHQSYGLKLIEDEGSVVISRIAILEDESIFQRYVNYVRSGLLA
jgi:hypothetical protein